MAFYPDALPPEPEISFEGELGLLLSKADQTLGAINTIEGVK